MSLRSKIVLILVTVVATYAALENGLTRFWASGIFGGWERQEAEEDLARIHRRIDAELDELVGHARMLAGMPWLANQLAFEREEDLGQVMDDAGADLLYVCDARGSVHWGRI